MLYESRWLQPWFKYQLVSIQIATNTPCVFTEVTSISVLVGAYFLLRKRQLISVLIKSDRCFKVKRTVQWNLCNPTPEFSDILWYPTKMYGAKVFLLTKIKPEYSDSIPNHAIHNRHLSLEGDVDDYFVHEECHAICMQFKTIYSSSSFWAVVDGPLQGKIVRSHIHLNIAHKLNTARHKTLSYKIPCLQTCCSNRECYWDTAHVTLIDNQSICKTSRGRL